MGGGAVGVEVPSDPVTMAQFQFTCMSDSFLESLIQNGSLLVCLIEKRKYLKILGSEIFTRWHQNLRFQEDVLASPPSLSAKSSNELDYIKSTCIHRMIKFHS